MPALACRWGADVVLVTSRAVHLLGNFGQLRDDLVHESGFRVLSPRLRLFAHSVGFCLSNHLLGARSCLTLQPDCLRTGICVRLNGEGLGLCFLADLVTACVCWLDHVRDQVLLLTLNLSLGDKDLLLLLLLQQRSHRIQRATHRELDLMLK